MTNTERIRATVNGELDRRCDGIRRDGRACGYLLAKGEITAGQLELACPKCHKRTLLIGVLA